MTAEVDFGALRLGDKINRTAIGSPFLGLFDADWEGWRDSLAEEITSAGGDLGIEFVRLFVEDPVTDLASGETRVRVLLQVVFIDEDSPVQPDEAGIGVAVLILLGVLSIPFAFNIGGARDDVVTITTAFADAVPKTTFNLALIAGAVAAIVLLR
jgi:hypothetical protein